MTNLVELTFQNVSSISNRILQKIPYSSRATAVPLLRLSSETKNQKDLRFLLFSLANLLSEMPPFNPTNTSPYPVPHCHLSLSLSISFYLYVFQCHSPFTFPASPSLSTHTKHTNVTREFGWQHLAERGITIEYDVVACEDYVHEKGR
jgi:hypothetical protein